MTTSSHALAPATPLATCEPVTDPLGYEKDAEYARRVQLGLRPITHPDSGAKGTHPDQRRCPSWCWIGQHEEYDHEINPDSPFVAQRNYQPRTGFLATPYKGRSDGQNDLVELATSETTMHRSGTQLPQIVVALRFVGADRSDQYSQRLKLSLDDAQEPDLHPARPHRGRYPGLAGMNTTPRPAPW